MLRCGIEIHQRLATGKKLFCNCATNVSNEQPSGTLIRRLRAVTGELGEFDPAAIYEAKRGKKFIYQLFPASTCLVEMDDEPPHEINSEALKAAIMLALMLKCDVCDEIHIMRKTVIDGSNTSGFQRTALIAIGTDKSVIKTAEGDVRIKDIYLEEESAGIVSKGNETVYRLDRLGIPLIEIGTKTDIKSPTQAKEVALKIGMLLRSTGYAMRGIGTIRQDINVSIEGGSRVEIKGLQEIDQIENVINREVERQSRLIEIKSFLGTNLNVLGPYNVTEIFKHTRSKIIKKYIDEGGHVYCIIAQSLAGLLRSELCKGKTLGRELADYAKAYGCKGLIHSDEDISAYALIHEFSEIRNRYELSPNDAIIIVAEKQHTAEAAAKAIAERIKLLAKCVPEETRVAHADGTTSYTRPLPGGHRLYPETDLPPIVVDKQLIKDVSKHLPEPWEKKLKRFAQFMPQALAEQVLWSEWLSIFEHLIAKYPHHATLIAHTLTATIKDLKRSGFDIDRLNESHLVQIFDVIDKKRVAKEVIPQLLEVFIKNPDLTIDQVIELMGIKRMSTDELEQIINDVARRFPHLWKEKRFSALMGEIMARVHGRIDGAIVAKKLKEMLK